MDLCIMTKHLHLGRIRPLRCCDASPFSNKKEGQKDIFYKKVSSDINQNVQVLRNALLIWDRYSAKLDQFMEPEPRSQQIDEVEEFIINAIRQASKKTPFLLEQKAVSKNHGSIKNTKNAC